MAVAQGNKPVTTRYRQFCLQAQRRQRAPFTCGLSAQQRPRRHKKRHSPSCGALTVAQPVLKDSAGSASPSFSFSTYRDDGTLSEVSIADCLDQEAIQHQAADIQTEPQHIQNIQSSANSYTAPPHAVQVKHILATFAVGDYAKRQTLTLLFLCGRQQNCLSAGEHSCRDC